MKLKIAILELEYHVECLYSLGRTFENSDHEITIFTSKKIYEELKSEFQPSGFKWHIWSGKIPLKTFLSDNLDIINKHDYILIDTLQTRFRDYNSVQFTAKTIVRIHNVNAFLRPRKSLHIPLTFFHLRKAVSYVLLDKCLRLDRVYFLKVLNKINFISLPDYPIQEYVRMNRLYDPAKIAPVIPFATAVPNGETYAKGEHSADIIKIIVPGGIDRRRRNYLQLFYAWEQVLPTIKEKVELILLGSPSKGYGTKIINLFNKLENSRFKLTTFNKRVPQSEYMSIICTADFLIGPINIKTTYKIYREIYGLTKISGIISDIIRYGKPAIIPGGYQLNKHMKGVIDQYHSVEDLSRLIEKYLDKDYLQQKYREIDKFLQFYIAEHVCKELTDFMMQDLSE